jgi:hypothetical protein
MDDVEKVLKHVASIPLAEYHDHISTSMPNDIILAARRVVKLRKAWSDMSRELAPKLEQSKEPN